MNCEIIRDLIPLYTDGTASAASRSAVASHLSRCEACRSLCAMLRQEQHARKKQTDVQAPHRAAYFSGSAQDRSYRLLAERLRRRKQRTDAANAAMFVLLCASFAGAMLTMLPSRRK